MNDTVSSSSDISRTINVSESFSFREELHTRGDISKNNLKTFKNYALKLESCILGTSDEITIEECEEKSKLFLGERKELSKIGADDLLCLNAQLQEKQKICKNIENIIRKRKEELKEIENVTEEYSKSRREYKSEKIALITAKQYYTTNFNIDVSINEKIGNIYEATVYFPSKNKGKAFPVKFSINREQKKVVDFDASSILDPLDEAELKKKFGDLCNVPSLVCNLRKYILQQ